MNLYYGCGERVEIGDSIVMYGYADCFAEVNKFSEDGTVEAILVGSGYGNIDPDQYYLVKRAYEININDVVRASSGEIYEVYDKKESCLYLIGAGERDISEDEKSVQLVCRAEDRKDM